jgi:hypothetical protein
MNKIQITGPTTVLTTKFSPNARKNTIRRIQITQVGQNLQTVLYGMWHLYCLPIKYNIGLNLQNHNSQVTPNFAMLLSINTHFWSLYPLNFSL